MLYQNPLTILITIRSPIEDIKFWHIDGLLRIHLSHYLKSNQPYKIIYKNITTIYIIVIFYKLFSDLSTIKDYFIDIYTYNNIHLI